MDPCGRKYSCNDALEDAEKKDCFHPSGRPLGPETAGFLGTGIIVELLKQEGTSHSFSYLLKIWVKMGASWSAKSFRQEGKMPSGPGAFLVLCCLKSWHTSSSQILNDSGGLVGRSEGCARGDKGCLMLEWVIGVNVCFPNLQ